MSLIHDALKKAQEEKKAAGAELGTGLKSLEPIDDVKKTKQKRTIVLAAVLVVALGILAYIKLMPSWDSGQNAALAPKYGPAAGAPAAGQPGAPGVATPQAIGEQDAGKLKQRAVDLFHANDLDGAWSALQTASQLNPNDAETWNNLGVVARKRGDLAQAREAFAKALQLKPEYGELLNNMASLEIQAGDMGKAKEYLDRSLKIAPASPEANFNMALVFDQQGDKKKAAEYYRRFLDVSGSMPSNIVDSVRDRVVEIEP